MNAPRRSRSASTSASQSWTLARLWPLAAVAALALLALAMGWHRALSLEALAARRAEIGAFVEAHYAAALLAYVGLYIAAVAVSVPVGTFLTITGGVLFGCIVGGLAAVIGASIGATLLFVIARYALRDFVRDRLGSRAEALAEGFRQDAFSYLLFLRLVPVFPFWLVNLAPALAGVGLRTFIAATAIGIIPTTFAFSLLGAGLDGVVVAQEAQSALRPFLAALTALGVAALIPVAVKRWRAYRREATPSR